jgi:hypothetical protein
MNEEEHKRLEEQWDGDEAYLSPIEEIVLSARVLLSSGIRREDALLETWKMASSFVQEYASHYDTNQITIARRMYQTIIEFIDVQSVIQMN